MRMSSKLQLMIANCFQRKSLAIQEWTVWLPTLQLLSSIRLEKRIGEGTLLFAFTCLIARFFILRFALVDFRFRHGEDLFYQVLEPFKLFRLSHVFILRFPRFWRSRLVRPRRLVLQLCQSILCT